MTKLYTFEVFIISGPVAPKFAKKNPVISRTIQICGNQTLERLHEAIFESFDREEEHMYQFEIGGKGPQDPSADRYVLPVETKSLFGDDWWWHQISVVAIENDTPKEKYPRIIKRVGASPPQYGEGI